MKKYNIIIICLIAVVAVISVFTFLSNKGQSSVLKVGLAPYQDMAILVNYDHLKLDKKYGINLELVTVEWGDLLPSVASAGEALDVSFSGLLEYLNKYDQMNSGSDDPVIYIFPLYAFKGAAFVTFNDIVPDLRKEAPPPKEVVEYFFKFKIGAQKYSTLHMMLFDLADKKNIPPEKINLVDIPLNEGLLAAQAGSIDIAGTGLTQRTEALKRGGRVVLDNDVAGFADVTGFVVKTSTLKKRRKEIESLIRIWFDCVDFVMSDLKSNSSESLRYLKETAATEYDVGTFSKALSFEYFPKSLKDANNNLINSNGLFSVKRISNIVGDFLVRSGLVSTPPPIPQIIEIN